VRVNLVNNPESSPARIAEVTLRPRARCATADGDGPRGRSRRVRGGRVRALLGAAASEPRGSGSALRSPGIRGRTANARSRAGVLAGGRVRPAPPVQPSGAGSGEPSAPHARGGSLRPRVHDGARTAGGLSLLGARCRSGGDPVHGPHRGRGSWRSPP